MVVHSPSPHQKVLLDSLFRLLGEDFVLAYAYPDNPERTWGAPMAEGTTVLLPYARGIGSAVRLREWVLASECDVWVVGSTFSTVRTQCLAGVLDRLGLTWAFLGEPPCPRSGLRRIVRDCMLDRILHSCHGVIATGRESARRYRQLLGDNRPVTSVPYYIPLHEWLAVPLASAPLEDMPVQFVTLAQYIHRKGLDILVEACRMLPPEGYEVHVYGDGPLRGRLERLVRAAGVPMMLHHSVPFSDRVKAFVGKHCFVFPTRWDGWGMAPVEALAAGLPVISSEFCMSAHDFVTNGVNGWIVPCAARPLADAMRHVLEHRADLPALSDAARRSTAGYDPVAGAAEIIRFCRDLR